MSKNNKSNQKYTILVVEDDSRILDLVAFNLEQEGYNVIKAENLTKGLGALEGDPAIDLVLMDVMLPEGHGHHFLDQVINIDGIPVVIMITASGSVQMAVQAMKKGAYDYLQKPFDFDELFRSIKRALREIDARKEILRLKSRLVDKYSFENIIGSSSKMQQVFRTIQQLTKSKVSVLIRGESGTGKELIAQAIHFNGQRKNNPFIEVNCAAIPATLIESELFGHEKGSFTGANNRHIGKFEQADGGTLFLDEIGDMSTDAQVRLLRAIQEREITRVGGKDVIKVDVRIVSATNQDLEEMMKNKTFREDLYYRLTVFPILVPPLRDRKGDVPLLVEHFFKKYEKDMEKENLTISPKALSNLMKYNWPGNVRELENCIQRSLILMADNKLEEKHLPLEILAATQESFIPVEKMVMTEDIGSSTIRPFKIIEREIIEKALRKMNGNVSDAADALQLGRATLYRKIKDYDIS